MTVSERRDRVGAGVTSGTPADARPQRGDRVPSGASFGRALLWLRRAALVTYAAVLVVDWSVEGIPFDREGLLLWIAVGLGVSCIGRHPVRLWWVVQDFVPFALVLVAYDYLRGWADSLGMPTWWTPQLRIDRALGLGHEPTVWLQERLKTSHYDFVARRWVGVQWYDVLVSACYYSFFLLPYVTAGVMWLRSRTDFYQWSLRFVSLSFFGYALFALIPSAPPWAAAACTGAQVSGHPYDPPCMARQGALVPGNLLGVLSHPQAGLSPAVERVVTRGFSTLHLDVATDLLEKGRLSSDAVAAVPSLHLGGTLLFVLFMWPRLRRVWRPLLVAYPLVMTFSLVYSAEHYLTDCIAGALAAWLVHHVANRVEQRRKRSREPDNLARTPEPTQELQCPPTDPLPAAATHVLPHEMTPSST